MKNDEENEWKSVYKANTSVASSVFYLYMKMVAQKKKNSRKINKTNNNRDRNIFYFCFESFSFFIDFVNIHRYCCRMAW